MKKSSFIGSRPVIAGLLIIGVLISAAGCKKPRANFTTDKGEYRNNEKVILRNQSENAVSYQWLVNNEVFSREAEPEFVIDSTFEGNINITLRAFSKNQRKSEAMRSVLITPLMGTLTVWSSVFGQNIELRGNSDNRFGHITTPYSTDPGCNANGCFTSFLRPGTYTTIVTTFSVMSFSVVAVQPYLCTTVRMD